MTTSGSASASKLLCASTEELLRKRYRYVFAASWTLLATGSVYAWSVFNKPLLEGYHFGNQWPSSPENNIAFAMITATLAIGNAAFGVASWTAGKLFKKWGPRKSALFAGIGMGLGLIFAGVGCHLDSIYVIWASFGVINGYTSAIGYVYPIVLTSMWFPDKSGLANGAVLTMQGIGGFIASIAFSSLINSLGVSPAFIIMGVVYGLLIIIGGFSTALPPDDWVRRVKEQRESQQLTAEMAKVEEGKRKVQSTPESPTSKETSNFSLRGTPVLVREIEVRDALRSPLFWGVFVVIFVLTICGFGINAVAADLAREQVGMTSAQASTVVALCSIFNMIGRPLWGTVSDFFGRPNTFILLFLCQIPAFTLLPLIKTPWLFQIVLFSALTCFGGTFACVPSYIKDLFGTKNFPELYSYILSAFSLAGIAGPIITGALKVSTKSFSAPLFVFAGMLVFGLCVSIGLKIAVNRLWSAPPLDKKGTSTRDILSPLDHVAVELTSKLVNAATVVSDHLGSLAKKEDEAGAGWCVPGTKVGTPYGLGVVEAVRVADEVIVVCLSAWKLSEGKAVRCYLQRQDVRQLVTSV